MVFFFFFSHLSHIFFFLDGRKRRGVSECVQQRDGIFTSWNHKIILGREIEAAGTRKSPSDANYQAFKRLTERSFYAVSPKMLSLPDIFKNNTRFPIFFFF